MGTALYKCCPNRRPAVYASSRDQEFKKQARFSKGPCKVEVTDRKKIGCQILIRIKDWHVYLSFALRSFMTRAWRIEYEGALYHVLSRGNDRRNIVVDDKDRTLFLDTAGEMAQRFAVDICAYVLMDNHYHL